MIRYFLSAIAAFGVVWSSHAVTFNIDAELLKTSTGNPIPNGTGLILLVADTTSNGFASVLSPGGSVMLGGALYDDDVVVGRWTLTYGVDGVFQDTTGSIPFFGLWGKDDPLQLYWFPELSLTTSFLSAGDTYGQYRSNIGADGSFPWFTPSAADLIPLKFFTEDASELYFGGSNPAIAGNASLQVIPEPSTVLLVAFGLLGTWIIKRRKK